VRTVERSWHIPDRAPEAEQALATGLGTSRVFATLLHNRGLEDLAAARAWVQPRLRDLAHPFEMKDAERAAERLRRAIRDQERILVWGDYDVDGMTGTVILMNFIRLAGGTCSFRIPNRISEGYSFDAHVLRRLVSGDERPDLVLTVDHGTSAHEGIGILADAGVDVVVTDHHQPPSVLPEAAHSIVNPRQPGCPSPFKDLCGAAVAYKLAWAAAEAFSGQRKLDPAFRNFLLEATGMVALATITDVVPLVGENRILCFHGLRALPVSESPGIRALLSRSRLDRGVVRAVHVAYRIGPRLNAAGRMGIAETAIELLTTTNRDRARALAGKLEEANDQRRMIEKETVQEILSLPELHDRPEGQAICIGRPGWHPGVIGIVASRLVDRFQVPALVCALDGDQSRVSIRSVPGVDVKVALDRTSEHLTAWGGHAAAAGATLDEPNFPAFRAAFTATATEALARAGSRPVLRVDLELPFRTIRPELLEELERLAPHGEANPPARFLTRNVEICGRPEIVGKERKHLVLHVREGERTFRAFGPNLGSRRGELRQAGQRFDITYELKFDSYRDPGAIELMIEDIRAS